MADSALGRVIARLSQLPADTTFQEVADLLERLEQEPCPQPVSSLIEEIEILAQRLEQANAWQHRQTLDALLALNPAPSSQIPAGF